MDTLVLKVNGMSCENCAKAVRRAVSVFEGYERAKVDLETGTVEIQYEAPATESGFIAAIENEGYTVEK